MSIEVITLIAVLLLLACEALKIYSSFMNLRNRTIEAEGLESLLKELEKKGEAKVVRYDLDDLQDEK